MSQSYRGTWTVQPNAWHARAYQYWQQHGEYKNQPDYRENLCHYWRVVVIWVPIAWVFNNDAAEAVGSFVGDVSRRCGKWGRRHKKSLSVTGRIFFIWGVGMGTVAVLIGAIVNFLAILEMVGISTASLAALWGTFYAMEALDTKRKAKKLSRESIGQQHNRPIRDTIQLIGRTAVAKKHSICPLVVIATEEQVAAPEAEPMFEPLVSPQIVARLEQEAVDGKRDQVLEPA